MFKKSLIFLLSFILISFSFIEYNKWKKPIENLGYANFIEGNKLVKENPQEALEQYKLAMEHNKDLNIKKNYEIADKKNQQQKEKEQQDKQEQQDQNNQKKQQNKDEKSNDQDQSNNKNTKQDQNSEQQPQPQQKQKQGQDNEKSEKYDQKKEELNSILQRLEGNEKQAFKNNEKILNSSENKDSENRW